MINRPAFLSREERKGERKEEYRENVGVKIERNMKYSFSNENSRRDVYHTSYRKTDAYNYDKKVSTVIVNLS